MGKPSWTETDTSAANTAVTVTHAAESDRQHVIRGMSASFSGTASGVSVQIKDGATVIWQDYVYDHLERDFGPDGLGSTKGNAVSATLAAGGGSLTGRLNLHGITN